MSSRALAGVLLAFLCVGAVPARAQTPLTLPPGSPRGPVGTEPLRRAPITVTPTFTITGEYNDNVFQDNNNRQSDFILGLTPGIGFSAESSTYRVAGSYSFTAEVYADHDELNDALARQTLLLEGFYRLSPAWSVSLTEAFYVSKNSNIVAAENVSTGRTRSITNTLSPGVGYRFDERTSLRGQATWTLQRYDTAGALDSDTYTIEGYLEHALTPRLSLLGGYQFSYFAIDASPDTVTHTPRLGAVYRFTPFLTGSLSGGPTFVVPENDSLTVVPTVTASLQQRFSWGSATLQYDRGVGTAGGLGGTSENQSIGILVQVDQLLPGLLLQAAPRYTTSNSINGTQNRIDVEGFSLTLQGRYQITTWVAAVAGYTYYHQRSSSTVTTSAGAVSATDLDQNRVFFGVQFGYPMTFD